MIIIYWLVVEPTHLKNDGVKVSWDDHIFPTEWINKIPWFQTTNQISIVNICKLPYISLLKWHGSTVKPWLNHIKPPMFDGPGRHGRHGFFIRQDAMGALLVRVEVPGVFWWFFDRNG